MTDSVATWHYIICRECDDEGEDYYSIREYYPGPELGSWTEEPMTPQGDSWSELVTDLTYMLNAVSRQVLDFTHDPPRFVDAHQLPR